MPILTALISGLLFGLGLVLSGMSNPAKVLNFLDVFGLWDPSLAFVMAGAVAVTFVGFRIVFGRARPVLAEHFHLPTSQDIDAPLLIGAVAFGIGWGLSGFCPGPAVTALPMLAPGTLAFIPTMLLGMLAARALQARGCIQASHAALLLHKETTMQTAPPKHPVDLAIKPVVTAFFEPETNTISYVVQDPASKACAIIDAVMDIDYAAGRISYASADRIIDHVRANGLKVEWLIETHAHADHLSGAPYIQGKLGGKLGIGEHITTVQDVFGKVFNEGTEFRRDGSQFDRLFKDGDTYTIGAMTAFVMHTPGHTPACTVHVIGDAVFTGDTLFMPDGGTARADFPGGDARQLYRSIKRVLALPAEMRLFMCHDYGPNGRDIRWETTVADERAHNIHVRDGVTEDEFVAMREARDKTLGMPKLIVPSLQVNIRAGHLPEPDANGKRFLKVPLNGL
jgi:glyoxylase-like metal-dependent hydrolase (beta-lactamase superfamily II)/uncharacterized membrane protein YedE/YeeE